MNKKGQTNNTISAAVKNAVGILDLEDNYIFPVKDERKGKIVASYLKENDYVIYHIDGGQGTLFSPFIFLNTEDEIREFALRLAKRLLWENEDIFLRCVAADYLAMAFEKAYREKGKKAVLQDVVDILNKNFFEVQSHLLEAAAAAQMSLSAVYSHPAYFSQPLDSEEYTFFNSENLPFHEMVKKETAIFITNMEQSSMLLITAMISVIWKMYAEKKESFISVHIKGIPA